MRRVMSLLAGALLLASPLVMAQEEVQFTSEFDVEECRFASTGRNPYWSLQPGDRLLLEGEDEGETLLLQVTVLPETVWITFETTDGETVSVKTRVIEEREWLDDELVEISRNFFARCRQTGDIFYFGEDVDIYEDGVIVSNDGQWRAGMDGAQPGIIMPGRFLLGARYYQEIAPDVALDRAENAAMGLVVETDAGIFDECIEILESTPLEPDSESVKVYCEGIGLVIDDEAELIDYRLRRGDDPDEDLLGGDQVGRWPEWLEHSMSRARSLGR